MKYVLERFILAGDETKTPVFLITEIQNKDSANGVIVLSSTDTYTVGSYNSIDRILVIDEDDNIENLITRNTLTFL